MNHGFEAKVDFSSTDDFGYILNMVNHLLCCTDGRQSYTRIVRLKQSNFDTFLLEVSLRLSKVQRSVVWRGVPNGVSTSF